NPANITTITEYNKNTIDDILFFFSFQFFIFVFHFLGEVKGKRYNQGRTDQVIERCGTGGSFIFYKVYLRNWLYLKRSLCLLSLI
ncbi:unnamed protein product, partial [Brassica napus]